MTIRNNTLCKPYKVSKISLRYGNECWLEYRFSVFMKLPDKRGGGILRYSMTNVSVRGQYSRRSSNNLNIGCALF